MDFKQYVFTRAKKCVAEYGKSASIIFPESDDERILEATIYLIQNGLAGTVFLVGEEAKVLKNIADISPSFDLEDKVKVINPRLHKNINEYEEEYFNLRKSKGITREEAHFEILNPITFAMMMVRLEDVRTCICGSITSSASVLLNAFKIIGNNDGVNIASSFMIMDTLCLKSFYGYNGILLFADCATVINPNAEELAEIALQTANSFRNIFDSEPKVAMLSFSTKGSAESSEVLKVRNALQIAKEKNKSLMIDGELQLDAAILKEVAIKKCNDFSVAGSANVLIFPNLEAGNIGYKLVERFAVAKAYGPFLQGLKKPVSDLSRGCTADDITVTSALMLTMS